MCSTRWLVHNRYARGGPAGEVWELEFTIKIPLPKLPSSSAAVVKNSEALAICSTRWLVYNRYASTQGHNKGPCGRGSGANVYIEHTLKKSPSQNSRPLAQRLLEIQGTGNVLY